MESDLITQKYGADTHVKRYPEIYKPYIYVEPVFCDKDITDYINEQSGNTEPEKEFSAAHIEESCKSDYQKQNDRIDYISKPSDTIKVQNRFSFR